MYTDVSNTRVHPAIRT